MIMLLKIYNSQVCYYCIKTKLNKEDYRKKKKRKLLFFSFSFYDILICYLNYVNHHKIKIEQHLIFLLLSNLNLLICK